MAVHEEGSQPKEVDEKKLEAIVAQQISLALENDRDEGRAVSRATALEYYQGIMTDLEPEEGRSSVVSSDVSDIMGWIMPGIMDVFTASDRMVDAEPVEEDDEDSSDEAADGMNYVFWKDNDGYQNVYDATWDALLMRNAIVKVFYDDTPVYRTSFHSGLSEDELTMLLTPTDGDGVGEAPEVLAHTSREVVVVEPETGEQIPVEVHDVKIKRQKTEGKFLVSVIPPEDFLIHADAITIESSSIVGDRQDATRSALIEEGFDRDKVMEIQQSATVSSKEDAARDGHNTDEPPDASMEIVDKFECYIRIDVDDDGVAEIIRTISAGDDGSTLLHWEVWEDDVPYADIKCNPIPHRFDARSLADDTVDIMQVKTVMLRQANDNIYAANNPQRFTRGKIHNMDELLNPSFGGVVRGDINSSIETLEIPFVANHAFEAIAYQDEVAQRRTGISKQSMALDPEALQNQSATANQNNKDASYSKIELLARNMAEYGGWKNVFKLLLRTMTKHQNAPRRYRLRNKWVSMDPRFWNADMDLTINVGLGTGSRDRDAGMLQTVLGHQVMIADRMSGAGFEEKALDMVPYIHNTLTKFAEATGLRNPEAYYPEFTEDDLKAGKADIAKRKEQPNPEMELKKAELQAKIQLEETKAKAQIDREIAQMDTDLKVQEADRQNTLMIERQKIVADSAKQAAQLDFERDKLATTVLLEREKMNNAAVIAANKPEPTPPNGAVT